MVVYKLYFFAGDWAVAECAIKAVKSRFITNVLQLSEVRVFDVLSLASLPAAQ